MNVKKWLSPILPYLAVWVGLFLFKNAWFTLIGFHVAILLALLILYSTPPIRILFQSRHPKWIVASILFCVTSGVGLYFLWDLLDAANDLPEQLSSLGLNQSTWPGFIAYFSVVNPFIEEYFWRGALGSSTKKLYPGDLIYAGYHVLVLWGRVNPLSILFAVIILTSAGRFWRQIIRKDQGLLASVLGHMVADFSVLLTIYTTTR